MAKTNGMLYMPAMMRDPSLLRAVLDARRRGGKAGDVQAKTGVAIAHALGRMRAIVKAGEEGAGSRGYTTPELRLAQAMVEEWDRNGAGRQAPMSARQVEVAMQIVQCNTIEAEIHRTGARRGGKQPKFSQSECDAIVDEFRKPGASVEHIAADYGVSAELIHRVLNGTYRARPD